jgi:uncharacterized protein DUF3892
MTQFGISKVRYNNDHTLVDRVVKHLIKGNTVSDGMMASRYEVVKGLRNGILYSTIVIGSNNAWKIQSELRMVSLNNAEYIKNDSSSIPGDDLGSLPEF